MDKVLKAISFVTSFNNFISDHKSITARIGLNENQFTDEIKSKLTFDRESHLKAKQIWKSDEEISFSSLSSNTDESQSSIQENSSDLQESAEDPINHDQNTTKETNSKIFKQPFKRKFKNLDMATCWLNSCLQLLLTAIDHSEIPVSFSSELGNELILLQLNKEANILDPTTIKHIIVTSEDTRIATRLSEITSEIDDQIELENRTRAIESLRLNLISGQQCVRDFFLCLQENILSWPDVFLTFSFKITHSTTCCGCNQIHQSETTQMYVELPVPPDNSSLNDYVEEHLNTSTLVGKFCEDGCQKFVQAEKRSRLTLASETEFLIVILTRAIETLDGFALVGNEIVAKMIYLSGSTKLTTFYLCLILDL